MPCLWPLVWTPSNRAIYVLLGTSVRRRIQAFLSVDRCTFEAGGILLGFRRDPHLEILDATLPTARDLRQPHRFVRRCQSHQTVATEAWKRSGRTIDYLGEWHTHHEAHPLPSGIDQREMIRRSREHRHEVLVELIIGIEGIRLGIVDGGSYVPLNPLNGSEHVG